jgi:hypothetical protein
MNNLLTLAILFALPISASARDVTIQTRSEGYSAPASVHFANLQGELARKAMEACGGEGKVAGLSNLKISIAASLDNGEKVASIAKERFDFALRLNYPTITASAVANCQN